MKAQRNRRRASHPAHEIRVESRRAAEEISSIIRRAHTQAALLTFAGALLGSVAFHLLAEVLR